MSPRIPILLYHRISASEPDARSDLDVPVEEFRNDMRRLHEQRWRCIDACHAAGHNLSGRRSSRTFALTFDDGYQDFADLAHPVLAEFGFTATVFIVTGQAGGRADWLTGPAPELLGVSEIRRLAAEGIQFGSHGVTHVPLTDRSDSELIRELVQSRQSLSEITGDAVRTMAWPYGKHDGRTRRAVAAAGYDFAFSVAGDGPLWRRSRSAVRPAARDPYAVPRREVHGCEWRLRRRLRLGPLDGLFVMARKVASTLRSSA